MTLGARIGEAAERIGGIPALERATGLKRNTIYGWVNNKTEPRADDIKKISVATNVSVDSLIFGTQMLERPHLHEVGEQPAPNAVQSNMEVTTTIRRFDIEASAGAGALALAEVATIELAVERTFLERYGVDPTTCFVMGIKGNSMYPTLADGDDAAVTTAMDPAQLAANHIWVFEDAVGLRVKRITRLSNGDYLITSDNRESRDEQVKATDFERDIRIIGRVFWSGGAIRPG